MRRIVFLILLLIPTLCFGQGATRHGSSLNVGVGAVVCPLVSNDTQNISFEIWYFWRSTSNIELLFSNGTGAAGYGLYINDGSGLAGDKLTLLIGGITYNGLTSSYTLKPFKWYHLCITRDNINWILYVNGDSVATGTTNPSVPVSSTSMYPESGVIDEVRLYRRTLSPTEVAWNYRHPDQPYSRDSLKLWLQFNEFTGTTTADSSGNGNNGTISGATWSIETPIWGASCLKP